MVSRELVKGSAGLLVLRLLKERDMYGYEMIAELARRSEGHFQLREGSLYPILHGLESSGHLEAFWKPAAGRKNRKYYRLTEGGAALLASRMEEWRAYQRAVLRVIEGES